MLTSHWIEAMVLFASNGRRSECLLRRLDCLVIVTGVGEAWITVNGLAFRDTPRQIRVFTSVACRLSRYACFGFTDLMRGEVPVVTDS